MNIHCKISFLENLLGKCSFSNSTKEGLFRCPFCNHHKKKLSINLLSDYWQCFPCGKAGKGLVFLLRRAKASKSEVGRYVKEFKSDEIKIKKESPNDFCIDLPDGFVPIVNCSNSIFGKRALDYLINKRGVSEVDIVKYKLGITNRGEYRNSIIFPSFDRCGNINFFTARFLSGGYSSPRCPSGYKNEIILNELNVDWQAPLIIVEGFFDLLKTDGNTIPLFGSYLSKESVLFKKIVENKSEVVLALDSDAPSKINKIYKNLAKYDVSCYKIDVTPFNDVGEMSKKEFRDRYENASVLSDKSVFLTKLRLLSDRSENHIIRR